MERIGGSRNGLFFAFPMLTIGGAIRSHNRGVQKNKLIAFLLLSFILGFCEATFLRCRCGIDATLDVTFFGWLPAVPLFYLSLNMETPIPTTTSRLIRKTVDIAYVIHVWFIVLVHDVAHIEYEFGFVCILLIAFTVSVIALRAITGVRKASFDNHHTRNSCEEDKQLINWRN